MRQNRTIVVTGGGERENKLLTGNIWGLIARYACPSVLSMLGISLYILADTYFIANGIGESALAALNIALPAYALIACVGNMIGIGGATVYAIARTVGNRRDARDVFTLCIVVVSIVGALLSLCGVLMPERIAHALGASSDTLPYARTYIRVLLLFAPAFVVNNVLVAFVRNDGAPNLAMLSMLSGVVFNIVFDYILIYIVGWGMFGAVFASCLAPLVGIAVAARHFTMRRNTFYLRRIRPNAAMLLRVIRGGAATCITELANGLIILFFNFKILAMLGDIGVAAYGVISNIAFIMVAIFCGIGQGVQPIASANFGADRMDRCREVARAGALLAFGLSCAFFGTMLAFDAEIAGAFNKENNAELARIAESGIGIYFSSLLFCGVNLTLIAWYQAIMRSRAAIAISLVRGIFGVVIGLAVLPKIFGAAGIWMTAPFADLLGSGLAALFLLRDRRQWR